MVTPLPVLHGGRPSLDFVNTVDPREPFGQDFLPDYRSLLAWSAHAALLSEAELRRARARARQSPADAARAHTRAIEVRELLYPVFCAAAADRAPSRRLADRFAAVATEAESQWRLDWSAGSWRWSQAPADELDLPVHAVIADALDVLLSGQRVVRCSGDRCGWVFADTSKNHSRRWCSMAGCGNRAKARRYQERVRAAS